MRIEWHGFLDEVVKPDRATQESCAWIFSERPFSDDDVLHVVEVTNVGIKGDPSSSFAPDPREFAKIKAMAKKSQYTRIGNVHTHNTFTDDQVVEQMKPSDTDLKYARRFNDVIRGIIIVRFHGKDLAAGQPGIIQGIVWHDQYGNGLELKVESIETDNSEHT
jgi:hypothetical protein